MASKSTYVGLADSFRQGIAKLNKQISDTEVSIQALKLQLAAEEQRLAGYKADKTENLAQLHDVRRIIHRLEDAETAIIRNTEDTDLV